MERDDVDRDAVILLAKIAAVVVGMACLAFIAFGCSDEFFVDFDPSNDRATTIDEEAIGWELSLRCMEREYERTFPQAVQPVVTFAPAVACGEDGNICCDPRCVDPGQACIQQPSGEVNIALCDPDEPCVPMRRKLRTAYATVIAQQHGIPGTQDRCEGE